MIIPVNDYAHCFFFFAAANVAISSDYKMLPFVLRLLLVFALFFLSLLCVSYKVSIKFGGYYMRICAFNS